jgi:hypothetical protein
MQGEQVYTPDQLVYGQCYVAASKGRFKKCEYYAPEDFTNGASPRMMRKAYVSYEF